MSRRSSAPAPAAAWDALRSTLARLPFEPEDRTAVLDPRRRLSRADHEEFALVVSLIRFTSEQHTRGHTWHDQLELFVTLDDRTRFRMGDDEVDLAAGDLLVVDHLTPHHVVDVSGKDPRGVLISFRPEFVYSLGSPSHEYAFLAPFHPHTDRRPRVLSLIEESRAAAALEALLSCWFDEPDSALQRSGCKAFLLLLLFEVARRFSSADVEHWEYLEQQERTRLVRPVFDRVRERYAERLTVADAARLSRLSIARFMRTFKRVSGVTLVTYVNHVRLAHGSRLLRETNWSVAEIANAVGFSDQSYFDKRFKRAFGRTPMEFRRAVHAAAAKTSTLATTTGDAPMRAP